MLAEPYSNCLRNSANCARVHVLADAILGPLVPDAKVGLCCQRYWYSLTHPSPNSPRHQSTNGHSAAPWFLVRSVGRATTGGYLSIKIQALLDFCDRAEFMQSTD